jgi:RimJ/RimL family protein N-acetyltransferase
MALLSTERLALREIELDDGPAVLAWQSDPAYLRFYPWTRRTEEDVREFVRMLVAWRIEEPRTRFQLAVTLSESGTLIGTCGVRKRAVDATEADVGIELAPAHWSRGYAAEAMRAVIDFAFRELKLHRVWAQCVAGNAAAVRLVERLGMTREGRLREQVRIGDRWHDALVYGLLENEWR